MPNVAYSKNSDLIFLSYCIADWGKIATIVNNIATTDKKTKKKINIDLYDYAYIHTLDFTG